MMKTRFASAFAVAALIGLTACAGEEESAEVVVEEPVVEQPVAEPIAEEPIVEEPIVDAEATDTTAAVEAGAEDHSGM